MYKLGAPFSVHPDDFCGAQAELSALRFQKPLCMWCFAVQLLYMLNMLLKLAHDARPPNIGQQVARQHVNTWAGKLFVSCIMIIVLHSLVKMFLMFVACLAPENDLD